MGSSMAPFPQVQKQHARQPPTVSILVSILGLQTRSLTGPVDLGDLTYVDLARMPLMNDPHTVPLGGCGHLSSLLSTASE